MPAQVLTQALTGGDSSMEDAPPDASAADQETSNTASSHDFRPDPDAQTTVTDFLDFTEYLPSDVMRSLTLIRNLDQNYADASARVHDLTAQWGRLPSLPASDRPAPVKLRADISEHLGQAYSSRVFAHAEAVRMSDNVSRHYNKAKVLLSKLRTMMANYPSEEEQQKSPVAARSPQAARKSAVSAAKAAGEDVPRRQPKIPKITVPGEVLAPYDIEYDTCTDGSDVSSDDDDDDVPATVGRRTPGPTPRIKLFSSAGRPPKSAGRPGRASLHSAGPTSQELAAHAAALLRPPPENAVIGSADAPWLQLTEYELAKLRKRMKKNATWTPSETMVARELRALGRGPEDYREAKRKAEEEGKVFEPTTPAPVGVDGSGSQQLPTGAISADSVATDEMPTSNRGMKLNEAKKLKREALAKQAAEEAEESARKMAAEAARLFMGRSGAASASPSEGQKENAKSSRSRNGSRLTQKRKRDVDGDAASDAPEGDETPSARPAFKRTKTETPVPPPQLGNVARNGGPSSEAAGSASAAAGSSTTGPPYVETPVPLPMSVQRSASSTATAKSPTPSATPGGSTTVTTSVMVPTKPPVSDVPTPGAGRRKSATPGHEASKRETRGEAAKRTQGRRTATPDSLGQPAEAEQMATRRSSSRGPNTAKSTPAPERRPGSRGKALSQEPAPSSAAADRPRRASTARNTPAPEARPPSRRSKRPAPGIVSTTSSGGSAAVGRRKAPPRKKARTTKREKDQPAEVELEDVDDEGNPIDPDEERYCICNRVSFGTMIQCDNVDVSFTPFFFFRAQMLELTRGRRQNCKQEWFHLECVGMDSIPARTTKWYCPDCRKLLNIGEKGEVSARGVRK